MSPEAGLNDGLLSLRIRTHNQCGVSAGGAITCDFGEGWSKDSAAAYVAASPSKKLKGALDACFSQQARAGIELPQDTQNKTEVQTTLGEPPAKKGRTGAAPTVANPPALAPVAAASSAASSAELPAASSAGLAVGTTDDWAVTIADSKLRINNVKGSSRKLPPKTVLQVWRGGKLVEEASAVKQFVVKKASELVVTIDGGKAQMITIAAYVAAHNITQIYQHGKFPAGHSPSALVCKKLVGYVPTESEASIIPAVIAAAAGASNCKVLWVMAKVEDKLAPVGLALVTTKQLLVPGNGVVAL